MSDQLHQLTQQFIHHLQVKNYAASTIKLRREYLGRFTRWCQDRDIQEASEVTRLVLQSYQRYLFHYRARRTGKPLKFSTQISLLVPIRAWFRYLLRENVIDTNPASDLDLPREPHRLPGHVLTPDQVETILNQPNIDTPLGLRNRAMLEVFYSTAMRRSELIHLSVYDVDRERHVIHIRQGKGAKDRNVPVGKRAMKWLTKYQAEIRPSLAERTQTSTLFISNHGRAFSPSNLSILVREYIQSAGITNPKGSCHLFRHAAATQMLENGADIRVLQQLLGHAEITTTQIYTAVSIQHLKEVHRRTHPADLPRQDRPGDDDEDNDGQAVASPA
jgi:integrase/recombinase XerD